jgi:hypothetical protein
MSQTYVKGSTAVAVVCVCILLQKVVSYSWNWMGKGDAMNTLVVSNVLANIIGTHIMALLTFLFKDVSLTFVTNIYYYDYNTDKSACARVQKWVSSNSTWSQSSLILNSACVPLGWVMGPRIWGFPIWFCNITSQGERIDFYAWSWLDKGAPHKFTDPDDEPLQFQNPNPITPPVIKTEYMMTVYKKARANRDSYWIDTEQKAFIPELLLQQSIDNAVTMQHILQKRSKDLGVMNGVFVLNSPPGKGKTTACRYLAHMLHASFCNSYDPCEPGYLLEDLIRRVVPTSRHPLVVVIEEVDRLFGKFGTLKQHRDLYTEVMDKDSWVRLLDEVQFMQNVVLILTTNISLTILRKNTDEALLRGGRVHGVLNMGCDGYTSEYDV